MMRVLFLALLLAANAAYGTGLNGSGGGGVVVAGSIVGGTDQCVLFDDAGTLGCEATFLFDKAGPILTITGGRVIAAEFAEEGADPADNGSIRLTNSGFVAWEASPTGSDVTLSLDASEVLQIAVGKLDGADILSESVTTTQIDDGTIATADVANGAITGIKQTVSWARVYHTTTQNLVDGALTAMAFDTESNDTDAYHDSGANTRLTAPFTGVYFVACTVAFALDTTGTSTRLVAIRIDGTTYPGIEARHQFTTVAGPNISVGGFIPLTAAQYVECMAQHTSGNDILTVRAAGEVPMFQMVYAGQ